MGSKFLLTTLTHQSFNQQAFTKRQQQKLEEYGSIQVSLNYSHIATQPTEMKWSDTSPTSACTSVENSLIFDLHIWMLFVKYTHQNFNLKYMTYE